MLLACFPTIAAAQDEEDVKTRINRIKRDTSYLYGEATMPTREEAMTLAKDFLCSYIEQWISETHDAGKIRSVVARDLVADCEELSLMRGSMFRAFAYVLKSDLYAVDTDAVAIPVAAGAAQTRDSARTPAAGSEDALSQIPEEGSGTEEVPLVAESRIDAGASDGDAPGGAEPPAVFGSQTVPDASSGAELSSGGDPLSAAGQSAPAETLYDRLVHDLCDMLTSTEVERLLQCGDYASACSFGEVTQNTRPQDISSGILVIYKSANREISALLSPKSPKRTNLKTGREDSTVNYPGCRAMWICLK